MGKLKLLLFVSLTSIFLSACGQSGQGDAASQSQGGQAPQASDAATFTFTAIPDQDEQRLRERFDKIASYLEQKLDVPVKYIPVKSYAAAVAAFANDQVQLAWFGGLSGVQARERVEGSQAIAQGEEDKAFKTYFIANASTDIAQGSSFPRDIEGKTFTFGSKGSTSGRLMPEFYVRQEFGKAPEEVFERVGFSGDHSRTIQLVQSGAYEVGAVNFKVWEAEADTIENEKVKVVWETPAYPDYQWTIRGDVNEQWGEGFQEKVTQALLNMQDPELLESFPRSKFVPASNSDYEPIKQTGKEIGILD